MRQRLLVGRGNDNLLGNAAANRLLGGGGNDLLDGLEGNDILDGGAGNDTHVGGAGVDQFSYKGTNSADDVRLTAASGNSRRLERRAGGQTAVVETELYFTEPFDLFLLAALGGSDIIDVALDIGLAGTVDGGGSTDTCTAPSNWTKLSCER